MKISKNIDLYHFEFFMALAPIMAKNHVKIVGLVPFGGLMAVAPKLAPKSSFKTDNNIFFNKDHR